MGKLNLLTLLLLGLFIKSCDIPFGKYDSFSVDLEKAKKGFPDSLINHFPEIIYSGTYSEGFESDMSNNLLFLEQEYDDSEMEALENDLDSRALAVYNASDSCLLVINRFAHKSLNGDFFNNYSSSMDRPSVCGEDYLPVPNFWQRSKKTTLKNPNRLPTGFTLYVLSAGNEYVEVNKADDDISPGKWRRYLPDNWKNGYTKGVAVNKETKEIIYWSATW